MSLSLCVLGSGSAGNCSLLSLNGSSRPTHLLVDAGLTPRQTNLRLGEIGLSLDDVSAIVVTHPDTDHLLPNMVRHAAMREIPLHIHSTHARFIPDCNRPTSGSNRNGRHDLQLMLRPFVHRVRFDLDAPIAAHARIVSHDDHGSAAFVFEYAGMRLGYATDLGMVPAGLFDHFGDLDMLAFESNYDRTMQMRSGRPTFLKRRIMGGLGHLSNHQSLDAVQRIAGQSRLRHIALLHLSRQCNDPALIRRLYARCASDLLDRVTISSQTRRTAVLSITSQCEVKTNDR